MRLLALLACATLLLRATARGDELKDTKYSFKVTIPKGFKDVGDQGNPITIHQYSDGDPGPGKTPQVIIIQRLHGTIAKGSHIKPGSITPPAGGKVTIENFKWNEQDLDLTRALIPLPTGVTYVIYGLQFPLPKEAVQLQLGGPVANDAAIRKLFESLAGSFTSLEK